MDEVEMERGFDVGAKQEAGRTVSDCETREAKRQAKRDKRWNRPADDKRRVFSMYCIMYILRPTLIHSSIAKAYKYCNTHASFRDFHLRLDMHSLLLLSNMVTTPEYLSHSETTIRLGCVRRLVKIPQ
ncbi:conserved hypothetical protein [Histoplasma capsulatum var. duboisii H88]|uniref:Uncharacterized protein n=1 Tax=Ajellomyces capsulatus (strain H88) TaxID=544711 RepID=F0U711_AJEC8|nr:conserved hypothetical protein [Histoplasma capsulatum var. duboisii H88]